MQTGEQRVEDFLQSFLKLDAAACQLEMNNILNWCGSFEYFITQAAAGDKELLLELGVRKVVVLASISYFKSASTASAPPVNPSAPAKSAAAVSDAAKGATAAASTAGKSTAAASTAGKSTAAASTAGNSTAAASTAGKSTAAASTAGKSTAAASTAGKSTAAASTAGNSTAAASTAGNSTAATVQVKPAKFQATFYRMDASVGAAGSLGLGDGLGLPVHPPFLQHLAAKGDYPDPDGHSAMGPYPTTYFTDFMPQHFISDEVCLLYCG
jgi:hypothetical protein